MNVATGIRMKRGQLNLIATYCTKCKNKISYRETDEEGTYTKKCRCGCEVYKLHDPDEYNDDYFYTKTFISAKQFQKEYSKKDPLEKLGFKKTGEGKYAK